MAPINFPDNPSLNQEFNAGSLIYRWNGTTWVVKSSATPPSSSIVSYSATAPANPVSGQVWVESDVDVTTIDTTTLYTKTEIDSALSLKSNLSSPTFTGTPAAPTAAVDTNTTQLATTAFIVGQGYLKSSTASSTYAPLASPTLTGTPTAPTATGGTNTTQIATTAFVRTEISNLVASAPTALDTLDELAAALGDDASFATTVTNSLASKAPLASPTFTGTTTFSNAIFNGTLDANEIRESVVDVALSSNSATLDWTAGNIYYIATAPTGNMTFNVTNMPTDNSKMMTINIFVVQGSTGYIPSTFQIGEVSQTIRWPGGNAPTATSGAGKIDIFSFTMQRTSGGNWIVYGGSSLNF